MEYRVIPITNIRMDQSLKRGSYAGPKFNELKESIKELGILQPVIVRPQHGHLNAFDKESFELRAGTRRFMAAQMLGLDDIPAMVVSSTDEEAMLITVTENLHREDLSPLEEGREVRTLANKMDVQTIARTLGKTKNWVVRRAQLTKLSPKIQKKVADPKSEFSQWSAECLELLAGLPEHIQDQVVVDVSWMGDVPAPQRMQQLVGDYTHQLKLAKWDKDCELQTLQGADNKRLPACTGCRQRSSCVPGLFTDYDTPKEKVAAEDRCLDPLCWEAKTGAYLQGLYATLENKHKTEPILVGSYNSGEHGFDRKRFVFEYNVEKCKKTAKDAKPCLIVDTGQVFWGKLRTATRSTAASGEKKQQGNPEQRAELANVFALAQLSRTYIDTLLPENNGYEPIKKETLVALSTISEYGYHNSDADAWLLTELGLSKGKYATLDLDTILKKFSGYDFCDIMFRLLKIGLFYALEDKNYEFDFPADCRTAAAAEFRIPKIYLEAHLRADIVRMAKDLGVKVAATVSKGDAVKAILDAKLPPGTLTKELKKAFETTKGAL